MCYENTCRHKTSRKLRWKLEIACSQRGNTENKPPSNPGRLWSAVPLRCGLFLEEHLFEPAPRIHLKSSENA